MAKRATDPGRTRSIRFAKELIKVTLDEAPIDRLAWRFAAVLNRLKIPYAVVSGYPAILLGRVRESEDVDILARPIAFPAFVRLHGELRKHFDCLGPGDAHNLYTQYLDAGKESTSVRYSEPNQPVPNVEFKFVRNSLQRDSVARKIRVEVNSHVIYIGPLDTQIAYKIWLGTPKDLEDALWIYRVAKEHLNEAKIWQTAQALGLDTREARRILHAD